MPNESEGNLCFHVLNHSYNYPTPLCKCTQPNLHSDIVNDKLLSRNNMVFWTPCKTPEAPYWYSNPPTLVLCPECKFIMISRLGCHLLNNPSTFPDKQTTVSYSCFEAIGSINYAAMRLDISFAVRPLAPFAGTTIVESTL